MYRILISAALVALVQSQCLLVRRNIKPSGACTDGATAPCQTPCAQDYTGNLFGKMTMAQCSIGLYSYACACVFTSTNYPTTCPAAHTDANPCVDLMPKAWCTSMCTSSITNVATICRDTCTCSMG